VLVHCAIFKAVRCQKRDAEGKVACRTSKRIFFKKHCQYGDQDNPQRCSDSTTGVANDYNEEYMRWSGEKMATYAQTYGSACAFVATGD